MLLRRYHKKEEKELVTVTYEKDKEKDLEELTVKELKEIAKEKNIEGYSNMKKEGLLQVLAGD